MVDAVLDDDRLLGGLDLLVVGGGLGQLLDTGLLLGTRLRAHLGEKTEGLGSGVLVKDTGELVDGRWDLEAHLEDGLLALQADVLGPLDEARKVALGLDGLADTKVTWALLDEGVGRRLLGR